MKLTAPFRASRRLIDVAPLAAQYERLVAAILCFVSMGQGADVLRLSYRCAALVAFWVRFERHNARAGRKLAMLASPLWRERVVRELGGFRKLKFWEAARARCDESSRKAPPPDLFPAWHYSPQRRAESERLKAQARACARAGLAAGVFRDRVKMDSLGQFRLAPIARRASPRRARIYSAVTIADYAYNAVPIAPHRGAGPASLWPAEIYAAMLAGDEGADKADDKTGQSSAIVIPFAQKRADDFGPLPLRAVMTPESYRSIFENAV